MRNCRNGDKDTYKDGHTDMYRGMDEDGIGIGTRIGTGVVVRI